MKTTIFALLLIALACITLYAQNNMPLLTMMTGAYPGAALGWSIASIDFNGDGIKDLVALERHWNPNGVYSSNNRYGRIHFYWGGTDFDNESDYSISGAYHLQYGQGWLLNVGDINNDGIEDLCYFGEEAQVWKICIFYGRQDPIPTPDIVLEFPSSQVMQIGTLHPLGDINGDGYADIGYVIVYYGVVPAEVRVLDGATLSSSVIYRPWWLAASSIRGIGDVNGDGIDDFMATISLSGTENYHRRQIIHFGSSTFPQRDSLTIVHDSNSVIAWAGCPLGDVNGDGIDDFAAFINSTVKVWYGSSNLSEQWDVEMETIISGGYPWGLFVHGDFNNDGFSDIASSDYNYGLNDGRAYLWMGRSQFNGTVDLVFHTPPDGNMSWFGYCMATGDFNNDGFCDLAISEPYSPSGPLWSSGRIHVYLGNPQLADTTVEINDPHAPQINEIYWDFSIYPNPLVKGDLEITLDFHGYGYRSNPVLQLELFNVRGQRLYSGEIPAGMIKDGKWTLYIGSLPSGVYITKISSENSVTRVKKFTVF